MPTDTVYEVGVWCKVWKGQRTVRGGEHATLVSVQPRARVGDEGREGDWRQGWVEVWECERSFDVMRFMRHSPTRTGWQLVALGTQQEVPDGLDTVMMVAEVWTQGARGSVAREAAMRMINFPPAGWRWLL